MSKDQHKHRGHAQNTTANNLDYPAAVVGDGGLHKRAASEKQHKRSTIVLACVLMAVFVAASAGMISHARLSSRTAPQLAAQQTPSALHPTQKSLPAANQAAALKIKRTIAGKPNVIFIVLDDADLSLMRYLPKTKAIIANNGASFTHYYDSLSLCCSARSTILRGQYVHNNGIWSNNWPDGGFGKFHDQGEENSTIATWLSAAQYQTSLMGKYLNEYPTVTEDPSKSVPLTYVPPGWSNWVSPVHGTAYKEFNYQFNINGVVDAQPRGRTNPANYMVDTISQMADQYVTDHASDSYFLYLAPYAPHSPYTPAPRYAKDYPKLTYPHKPSFNESDISDKPTFMASYPPLTSTYISQINADYRNRVRDMEGIDDLVQNLYNSLQASGQLDHTYLIFTSDNGLHMGEHRLPEGKLTAYEEDIHLPLWISGPGITPGTVIDNVVSDVDLAPTFAELTGATLPDFVDGHSLVPLLAGSQPAWRKYLLLERSDIAGGGGSQGSTNVVSGSGILEPLDTQPAARQGTAPPDLPAFSGLVSSRFLYVDYYSSSGVNKEFYDLAADPYELQNLLGPGSPGLSADQQSALSEMQSVLADQKSCSPTTTPCL